MTKSKSIRAAKVYSAFHQKPEVGVIEIADGEDKFQVEVKRNLTLTEMCFVVSDIANMMFQENEDGEDEYAPFLSTFAYGFNILNYFTNISLPTDHNVVWKLISETPIVELVLEKVPEALWDDITTAVNRLVKYKVDCLTHRGTKERIGKLLGNVVDVFKDKVDGIDGEVLVDKLIGAFPEIKEDVEKLVKEKEEG